MAISKTVKEKREELSVQKEWEKQWFRGGSDDAYLGKCVTLW